MTARRARAVSCQGVENYRGVGVEFFLQFAGDERVRNAAIILGVGVAIVSIGTARALARKKQAADLIFAVRSDTKMQEAAECLKDHSCSHDKNIKVLAGPKKTSKEAELIRYLLNHFESLSVGIQNGIYDERMLKESWYTIVIKTYQQVRPYIEEIRARDQTLTYYQEFEQLAERWKKRPLKQKVRWRHGAFQWYLW